MVLYTDASGTIGYGGYFNGKWIQARWLPHMQLSNVTGISIEWQDLFSIVIACAIWYGTPIFPGNVFNFEAINESVVAIINSGHSKYHQAIFGRRE